MTIIPYFGNISCGIDKALELPVSDFLDIHVERVHMHQPLRAFSICRDAWVVCSHQELSSRNQHRLYPGAEELSYESLNFEERYRIKRIMSL